MATEPRSPWTARLVAAAPLLLILSIAARLAWTYLVPNGANFVDLHVYVGGAAALADPDTLYHFVYAEQTPDFPLPFDCAVADVASRPSASMATTAVTALRRILPPLVASRRRLPALRDEYRMQQTIQQPSQPPPPDPTALLAKRRDSGGRRACVPGQECGAGNVDDT